MKAYTDRLLSALESLKKGDQMVFTYVPGTGTTLAINGRRSRRSPVLPSDRRSSAFG